LGSGESIVKPTFTGRFFVFLVDAMAEEKQQKQEQRDKSEEETMKTRRKGGYTIPAQMV